MLPGPHRILSGGNPGTCEHHYLVGCVNALCSGEELGVDD